MNKPEQIKTMSAEATPVKAATKFMKVGSDYTPIDSASMVMMDNLPPATYVVAQNMTGELFLKQIENFSLKHKLYGDVEQSAERILTTFNARPMTTGVLLEGEKGSGKSMLMKRIAIKAVEDGLPVIVINSPFCGDAFNTFLQGIRQPAVILLDEFEKTYDGDNQEKLLTTLDGTFPSKKLFILTVNDKYRIDRHMQNRPGRIYYNLSFAGLSEEFIAEYCADELHKKENTGGVQAVAAHFDKFTFDMLKALVEEMNRYGENATSAMRWLNINPGSSESNMRWTVSVSKDGFDLDPKLFTVKEFVGNPGNIGRDGRDVSELIIVGMNDDVDPKTREALALRGISQWIRLEVRGEHLAGFDRSSKTYTFNCDNGFVLTMKQRPVSIYDYNYDVF